METPVIYFYADRETTVSVKVEFSRGKITEWYPQARFVYVPPPGDVRTSSSIDWGRMTVEPGAEENFPVEAQPSHYYPARDTDAAPLRICTNKGDQHEKFLFYRGVGTFNPPVEVKVDAESVVVRNTQAVRSELTRILVGRVEIITPEMRNEIRRQVVGLKGSGIAFRRVAAEVIRKHGRFAEPVLKDLLGETNDPTLRLRIQRVIDSAAVGSF